MSGNVETIESAVGSARLLGPFAFDVLLQGIEKGDDRTRAPAIRTIDALVSPGNSANASDNLEALRRLRPEGILINALDDADRSVAVLAALILARLGDDAGADELARVATAADPKFGTIMSRHYGMAALHALGRPGYLPILVKALEHADQHIRVDAALAMRSFAHPSMYDAWNATWRGNAPSDVRSLSFQGLVALRGSDRELLRAGLADRDPRIRLRAAEALLALGSDTAAVDTLERLATETGTRNLALGLLITKGDPRRTAVVARSLLPKPEDLARMHGQLYDPEYRLTVVYTLGEVKDAGAVAALGALFGPDWTLNSYVARALVAIGDESARRALVRAMESPDSVARIHAAGGVISLYDR
jgi:HEAT repeat protein